MILGMSVHAFTVLHTFISLIAIAFGAVVAVGLIAGRRMSAFTGAFLSTTALTSITGFLFPGKLDPARIVGLLSLLVLALAIYAYYVRELAHGWRATYVSSALVALYLNCFVAVIQAFQKIPFLHVMAPNGNEAPFAITQLALLALFITLGFVSVRRFHPPVQIVVA